MSRTVVSWSATGCTFCVSGVFVFAIFFRPYRLKDRKDDFNKGAGSSNHVTDAYVLITSPYLVCVESTRNPVNRRCRTSCTGVSLPPGTSAQHTASPTQTSTSPPPTSRARPTFRCVHSHLFLCSLVGFFAWVILPHFGMQKVASHRSGNAPRRLGK